MLHASEHGAHGAAPGAARAEILAIVGATLVVLIVGVAIAGLAGNLRMA